MRKAAAQYDLFDGLPDPEDALAAPQPAPRRRARAQRARTDADPDRDLRIHEPAPDCEAMAHMLEETGDFRILRRLRPRTPVARTLSPFPRLGVIVDTETTGLRHDLDEVIEIGVVAFTYGDDGAMGDVVGVYGALQEPSGPIPAEITRLTGITDAMVAGQRIDLAQLDAMVAPADLVIAHNAGFDRPFCECLSPVFSDKPWACSVKEVPWRDYGFEGSKLGYLVGQAGLFHDGHRAVDDCHALLEVLTRPVSGQAQPTPFAALLEASAGVSVRIWAERSPFDMKDQLKARGYRWNDGADGRPKSWWIEVAEADAEEELRFLREEIYQWPEASPYRQVLGALERYRKG